MHFTIFDFFNSSKSQVWSSVHILNNLLMQICFLIHRDKWSSFIFAGNWHSIRSSPGRVLWLHFWGTSHSQRQRVHLAICQQLLWKQPQQQHSQDTTGIIGNQTTARIPEWRSEKGLCAANTEPVSWPEERGCEANSQSSRRQKIKRLMNHPGGEIYWRRGEKWQQDQQLYKKTLRRDKNIWLIAWCYSWPTHNEARWCFSGFK